PHHDGSADVPPLSAPRSGGPAFRLDKGVPLGGQPDERAVYRLSSGLRSSGFSPRPAVRALGTVPSARPPEGPTTGWRRGTRSWRAKSSYPSRDRVEGGKLGSCRLRAVSESPGAEGTSLRQPASSGGCHGGETEGCDHAGREGLRD